MERTERSSRLFSRASLLLLALTSNAHAQDAKPASEAAAAKATSTFIPYELFAARPPMSAPLLSPAGDRIAARVVSGDTQLLATLKLFDTDDGVKRGLRPFMSVNAVPAQMQWITNDLLLIQTMDWSKLSFGAQLTLHNVVTEQQRTFSVENMTIQSVVHVDRDGKYILASARRPTRSNPAVFRIDLESGATTEVQPPTPPVTVWYADSNGVVRLGSGRDGKNTKFLYRESAEQEFQTVAKFRWQDMEADVDNIRFRGGKADKGFIVSNVKTGRFAVYEFDWKSFEIGEAIFEHPRVDVDTVWLSSRGDVSAVLYTDEKMGVTWLDPALQGLQAEIDKALGGRNNLVVSMDESQTKFIVLTSTPDDPGHYYYFNRPAGVMKRIASVLEVVKGQPLAPMQPVSYTSRDGLKIPGYLTVPKYATAKNLPLIVMPHGGPHVRDVWQYDPIVQFLANRGYAVLQPNFRGSSGYGKDFLEMGYGQWGGAMQDDLTDGVGWLVAEGIVDPKRVCIMGGSYGGYAALMGVIKAPDVFRCAVSFAGVTNVDKLLTQNPNFSLPSRYARLKAKLEGEQEIDLKSVSPVKLASKVGSPILLAHGRRDGTVRYVQAEEMVRALKSAKKQFEFVEFKEAGHGFAKKEDLIKYLQDVEAFLKKHNPSDPLLATKQ